ncbi:MAG: SDR family NAD(P)-dependent oxidoreductase [Alphaproteobacteria bacterium]|nr:SDR family NAD(P)-dependent oxidoreductase [Alphaproteobacteria bacterium]
MAAGLEGQVAIVTGGGRGTGQAIAAALVAAGARVVIADNGTSRDGHGADPTVAADAAAALGGRAIAFTDSIASPGAAQAIVDRATRAFGGLDIVVNSAAIRRPASHAATAAQDWEAVLRTNLSAAFYLTSAAGARMRAQRQAGRAGGGYQIINLLPRAGLYGSDGRAAEVSARAGLAGLTRAMALELAEARVSVNAVLPLPPARPPGGEAPPLDARHIAALVVALCHPVAEAITGQVLGVRGAEVLLFGPVRPVARLADAGAPATPEALATALLQVAHAVQARPDGELDAIDLAGAD